MRSVLVFSIVVSFFLIAPIAYMTADNAPPYVYDVKNSYVVPLRPRVQFQVTVHWALKRVNRVCPGFLVRYIIDADTMVKTTYDAIPVADNVDANATELNRTFLLSPNITPGPKIYRAEGFYSCNPLQHIWPLRVVTPDLHFEVVE